MTDRTVRVRLEADISDFVSDIGGKAVAAVKRLQAAASKADGTLKKTTVGASSGIDDVGSKADTTAAKVSKIGDAAQAVGDKVSTATSKASKGLDGVAASTDKTQRSTAALSKTTSDSTKNTDAQAAALGKLRVAQAKLAELQNKPGAKTSQVAAAEESVAAAERNVKRYEKAGNDSGKAFGSGFKKWLTGGGGEGLGKSGGTVFGSGFIGALKTPILGPAIIAILTAAFVTAMPAVGAVAGGALVTGFGAGIAGLGILFAAQSDRVGQKWTTTLGQLGSDMKLLSVPFEGTLINIADIFQRTVDKFNPALAKAFSDTAGPVEGFVARFGGSLEQLIPALDPIVRAFNAVLDDLGPAFQSLLGDMASSLTELAASVEKNPEALGDFVAGIGEILGTGLQLIQVLNDMNAAFDTLTSGTSIVDVVMEGLEASMVPLITLFTGLSKAIDLANVATGKTGKDVADAGQSMSDAANETVKLAQGLDKTGAAAQHGAAPIRTLAERMAEAKKEAAAAAKAFEDYIDALFRVQNLALGLSGAQINLQSAFDKASESIKENGRTLNINTEKGRANKAALNEIAQSANAQTEAMIRGGKGIVSAARAAELSRANFVKLAMQMGATRPVALAMAKQLIAIPNVSRTAKLEANKKDLDAKLAAARKALADPKLSATKKAKLQAEIAQLLAAKRSAQAAIDSLRGKTVALTVNTYKNQLETVTYKTVGVKPIGQADGGYWPNGIPSYADGKLPKQATVAQGKGAGLVQWAEKETGGEAFIPLAPSKRERSTQILGQVAGEFGLGLVKSFADGGFTLPGGRLVDIALLLKQMGVAFNPTAGVNYTSSLNSANRANRATVPARDAALRADRVEQAAKAQVAAVQRAITLQQRHVAELRKSGASEKTINAEQRKTIALQDKLYVAKKRVTVATAASSKADAVYKIRVEATQKAIDAHAVSVEKLIEQQKAAVDFADQISQSLTGGANIGDLFAKSLTGKGLLSDLQGQGASLSAFRVQIEKLRKMKLSEEMIQQIIGKGADQGGEVAKAILDGGLGLVAALNKAQAALDAQANLIGAGSAIAKYGVKIGTGKASGGDVQAGTVYPVGERGMEMFQPGVSGRIIPNQYVGSAGGTTYTRIVEVKQYNTFTGVSMAEADLIAQRANAKVELAAKGY